MDIGTISLVLMLGLLILLAIGMPLGLASAVLAVLVMVMKFEPALLTAPWTFGDGILTGRPGSGPLNILAQKIYGLLTDYVLISIPLFIFMASLLERSGIAKDMYSSLSIWLNRTRGGIAIVTSIMAVIMAAMSGIIGGEVVLLGLIALPQMLRLGYKYKLFKLGSDPDMIVCIRSQNHFYNPAQNELSNLFVLLEWHEKRQCWTKDLDLNTTMMLTKEITDNSTKFNRWTMQSIIDGVDKMRFAFVQRLDASSARTHKCSGMIAVNPTAFANQINLNVQNCWATLKDVIASVLAQEVTSAEYLYMKEPVNTNYRLIHMIKSDEDEDDEDDEDDGL